MTTVVGSVSWAVIATPFAVEWSSHRGAAPPGYAHRHVALRGHASSGPVRRTLHHFRVAGCLPASVVHVAVARPAPRPTVAAVHRARTIRHVDSPCPRVDQSRGC